MDMNTIIKVFRHNVKFFAFPQLIPPLIIFLTFYVVTFAIMTIATPDTYINIAASFAGIYFFIASLVCGIISFTNGYYITIKLGISRKNHIVGTLLYHASTGLYFFVLMLITQAEGYFNNYLFGGFARLEIEQFLPSVLDYPLLYAASPLIIALVCIMLGVVVLKFGINALTLFFTCLFALYLYFASHLEEIKAFFGGAIFMDINVTFKIILAIILITTALTASIKFYLNHDVNTL